MNQFNMVNELRNAWEIVLLKRSRFSEVYNSGEKFLPALLILFLPPVLNLFLSSLMFPSGFGVIFSAVVFWPMIIPTFSLVACIFILFLVVDKWLAIELKWLGIFKLLAYASLPLWLSPVPFLLELLGVSSISVLFGAIWHFAVAWVFVVAYYFLRYQLKLSDRDLAISMVVTVLSYFVAQSILGRLLVGTYYRLFY